MTQTTRILPFIRDLNPSIDNLPKIVSIVKSYQGNRANICKAVYKSFKQEKKRTGFTMHSVEANTVPSLGENNLGIMTADAKLTELGKSLANAGDNIDLFKELLGTHLLRNRAGWQFCRGLSVLGAGGQKVTRENLASFLAYKYAIDEWRDLNNISSLHSFLEWVGVVSNYELNEAKFYELMSVSPHKIKEYEQVSPQARDLLASLVRLGGRAIIGKVREGAEAVRGYLINVHQVPFYGRQLTEAGLIDIDTRRGRKDTVWKVKDQKKVTQIVELLANLSATEIMPDEVFSKSFKVLLKEITRALGKEGRSKKGVLLEIFAAKICWLLGLQRILFRRISEYEVDVSAESLMPIYASWVIQCKATVSTIGSEVLLREYAIAQLEGAQIICLVTTADFSSDCRILANHIQKTGKQVVLLDKEKLKEIAEDESKLYEIMREQSKRTSYIKRGYSIHEVFNELDIMEETINKGELDTVVLWRLVQQAGIEVPQEDFDSLYRAWKMHKDAIKNRKGSNNKG